MTTAELTSFFARFSNPTFVETGISRGRGIAAALQAGFRAVRSVEIRPESHARAARRYAADGRVALWLGDSADLLGEMIRDLPGPATFWLDAHWMGRTPILAELEAIRHHPLRGHAILIDDVRLFGTAKVGTIRPFGIPIARIEAILGAIDPAYEIRREGDVLVATARR